MERARIPTSEQLMAEMGWIRRLARALVQDRATAEDLAQETWLVANAQQPDEERPLRPWLARVVVNLVRTQRRSEARREQRNVAFDDGRSVPTPAELVERVELQRALADEVLALAEPYRSTVLLHFIEGYSSAEIAHRSGIPGGTVRRRLKVALDQLRDALRARTDQPKRGWMAALVPFARSPHPKPASIAVGVIAMKKVTGIVIALVLLVLLVVGGGALWHKRANSGEGQRAGVALGSASPRPLAEDRVDESAIPTWIPQAGAPPRRIAGRVVFRGSPIAGARVQLGLGVIGETTSAAVLPDSVPNVLQRIAEVKSAADGTFDFGVQPPAVFTVSASATNHAAASVVLENADPQTKSEQLVLALGDCKSRLVGVVADASGGPIRKARVSVAGLSGTETGADGSYSVCLVPRRGNEAPRADVRVEADGYGTIKHTVIVVGELRQDFMLVPEAALVGRVLTNSGEPVAGARVVAAAQPMTTIASGWALSDRDGRFRIDALAPGTFELSATAHDGMTASSVTAVARATTTSHEIRLVIAMHARVRGVVVVNGTPVSGAAVTALHDDAPASSAFSQADGSFVLDRVPYGATQFLAHPYQVDAPKEIKIERAVVDDVRIEVTKLASVRGHVTRERKPVAGAHVVYLRAPQAFFFGPPLTATTDSSGAYMIDGLPAGPGRLVAWDAVGKALARDKPLDIAAGETKTVDVDLDCWGEVKGTVVDQAGAALAGVYVRMDISDGSGDMCEAMTDASGQFACAMLIGGMYRPTVSPLPGGRQGFAPAKRRQFDLVRVPQAGVVTGVTIAVKNERLAIRGTVFDDTGTPLADARIEAIGRGPSSMDFPYAMSDANGRFEIANLARGMYALHALGADGSETEVPSVAAGTDSVTIKLARAGAIEGTLIGFSTTPRVAANRVVADGGSFTIWIPVDGTKFFRIGVPPGRYTVEARAGAEVDGQAIEIRPGETVRPTLRSRGVGRIEGTVLDHTNRKPLAEMRCDANLSLDGKMVPAPPDPSYQAFTDAAGQFALSSPTGRVRIFCFPPHGGPQSPAGADVEVTAATPAKVNVFSVRAAFGDSPGDAGFTITPLTLPLIVNHVEPKGPAATSGLRVGDQLVAIDGASLDGVLPAGATTLIANHRRGTTLTLGIARGGVAQTVKILIADP